MNDQIIIKKICRCIAVLGGKSDLLGTIESWKNTLPDEDVIASLDSFYEESLKDKERELAEIIEYGSI